VALAEERLDAVAERVRELAADYDPPAFDHVPDSDAALFLCAIDHSTGYREEHTVAGEGPFAGSALLWAVAIDAAGRLYFENQLIEENELRARLRRAVKSSSEPLALVIAADKSVPHERVVGLARLARDAGIPVAAGVVFGVLAGSALLVKKV